MVTASQPEGLNIRIITHNIRYATKNPFKGEEIWQVRQPRLCAELNFNTASSESFICLQEVLHDQLKDILRSLNSSDASPGHWDYVGVGRDDGKQAGEYSPILYRPSVWQLLSSTHRWLRPDYTSPGKGWDASSIRIVTLATFKHLQSGHEVLVMNTHLDNNGAVARLKSVELILEWIEQSAANGHPPYILLTGDFNSPPSDSAYALMTSSRSSMEDVTMKIPVEKRYGNELTYTSFGFVDNVPARIDFIFARKLDHINYKSFGVLANRFDDGVYISDHRACVADVQLPTRRGL